MWLLTDLVEKIAYGHCSFNALGSILSTFQGIEDGFARESTRVLLVTFSGYSSLR